MRRLQPWISTAIRLVLGAVWIAAGVSKISDLAASGRAVNAYRLLPYDVATGVGTILPVFEIALGALLILGLATRLSAVVSTVLLITFIAGIGSARTRGLRIECGCFGGGGDLAVGKKPEYVSATIRDIALLIAAGLLAVFPQSRFSLDGRLLDGGRA